ncbi:conserved hypothetical protein, secreted [Candidatus Thiomargarita nelsonii]|uniref:Porin n=1 Tax=Candidatus Thiomargarita nelsonii TaxID=1003181 RepID=A0A176RUL6_9GAMM|nr:conserved hypothetical protein, secreted [Candidatus Thiomargarita nelsonii]
MENIINKLRLASLPVLAVFLTVGTMIAPSTAQADMFSSDKFTMYGDFRLRLEADWDSQKADGTQRSDRNRARIRARVGLKSNPTDNFTFGVRLRSGSDNNHLSPHITIIDFDDNNTGDADFNFDKWFLKAKTNQLWGWVGRNSLPFWKQNEMFWDDDATPVGLAAGYKLGFGAAELALNTAYFTLPAGMHKFSGNLGLGQLVFSTKFGGNKLTAAAGFLNIDANPDDPDAGHSSLWDNNGFRDYQIWIGSLQAKAGNLTLGVDWMHNAEDYSETDPDPFTVANRDETDAYVASIIFGKTKEKGDWLLGYYYAHIETLAINSSYAQDDWGRWNPQSSNMKGHEVRMAYKHLKFLTIVGRFYLIEDITDDQDGKRFRLDFNYKF